MWNFLDKHIKSDNFSIHSNEIRIFSKDLISYFDNNYNCSSSLASDQNLKGQYGYCRSFVMIYIMMNLIKVNPAKYSLIWKKTGGHYPVPFEIALGNEDCEHPKEFSRLFSRVLVEIYSLSLNMIIPIRVKTSKNLKKYINRIFQSICWMNLDKELIHEELINSCLHYLFNVVS